MKPLTHYLNAIAALAIVSVTFIIYYGSELLNYIIDAI